MATKRGKGKKLATKRGKGKTTVEQRKNQRQPDKGKKFVESIDLSGTPRGMVADAATEAGQVFDQAKSRKLSPRFSFAQGVGAEAHEAISDSAC
jgi:hypothetical protein